MKLIVSSQFSVEKLQRDFWPGLRQSKMILRRIVMIILRIRGVVRGFSCVCVGRSEVFLNRTLDYGLTQSCTLDLTSDKQTSR